MQEERNVEKARKTAEIIKIRERMKEMEAADDKTMVMEINKRVATYQEALREAAGIETNPPPPRLALDSNIPTLLPDVAVNNGGSAAGSSSLPSNDVACSSNDGGLAMDPTMFNMNNGGAAVGPGLEQDDFAGIDGSTDVDGAAENCDLFLGTLCLMGSETGDPNSFTQWD